MSDDPTLLFVKPGTLRPKDRRTLDKIGIVVIETADPQSVKFTRAGYEVPYSTLLCAATKAIWNSASDSPRIEFARRVMRAVLDVHEPPNETSPSPRLSVGEK